MQIAVLGTGIMGAGMARSLRRNGHDVRVWNRTRSRAEPLSADGIVVADSVGEAVHDADAVITMLFDVDSVLGATDELLDALADDAVWIQASTVGIDGMRRVADRAAQAGRAVLDAPVLGTKKPAEDGKLTVLVAGAAELIERVRPVFDAIGVKTVVVSERVGDGSALKLVCNSWIGTITAGTAQAITFARSLGVDPALFLQAIDGAPVDSAYAQVKGAAIINDDYATSFAVDGVVKDIELMLAAAGDVGFRDDLLESVRSLFESASAAGHGDRDMAAVRFAFDNG